MKNAKVLFTRNATVYARAYLPFPAHKNACETATHFGASIAKTAGGFFKATCETAKIAKAIADKVNADYAHAVSASDPAPAQKPKASAKGKSKTETVTVTLNGVEYTVPASALVPTQAPKKQTTAKKSATPRKAKGEAFDFSKIKGKTASEKNRALHKELVKMGLKDSRTPEYMSVWIARPWAK